MKIIRQGLSLSESDLNYVDSEIATKLLRNRLLVEFDESPDIDAFNFSGCTGFYHIKSLGSKIYQFWFENKKDYDVFYENVLAYKLTLSGDDK